MTPSSSNDERRIWSAEPRGRFGLGLRLALFALFAAQTSEAQLPRSELRRVFPPGGAAGSTVDLSIEGSNLEAPGTLRFSAEGFVVTPVTSAPLPHSGTTWQDPKKYKVEIADEVHPGVYEVRFHGPFGVSGAQPFVVGRQKEVAEAGDNNEPAKAMRLENEVVVNGRTDPGKPDIYSVEAKAGETIALECVAGGIGSRLEPRLVLRSPEGTIVCDSAAGLDRDGRLAHTAASDGAYLLAVMDYLNHGGDEYYYRLCRRQREASAPVFPPAVERGKEGAVRIGERAVTVRAPDSGGLRTAPRLEPWHVVDEGFEHEGAWIGIADAPVVVESDTEGEAVQLLTVPCEVAGRFSKRGERDRFDFKVEKGKIYFIEVLSERLGHDTDVAVAVDKVIVNEQGIEKLDRVTAVDDMQNTSGGRSLPLSTRDPVVRIEWDADALFRVNLWDNFGGEGGIYRMRISESLPDFKLLARPAHHFPDKKKLVNGNTILRKGGAVEIDVYALRRDGFEGEIALSVEGLPPGIEVYGDRTFPTKDLHSRITLVDKGGTAPWSGTLRIAGKAKIGEAEVVRAAIPVQLARTVGDYDSEMVELRTGGQLVLSLLDETHPLAVEASAPELLVTSLGGSLDIPFKLKRTGEFKGKVKVQPVGIPGMAKAPQVDIDAKAGEGTLKFVFNAANNNQFRAGEYAFLMRADGTAALEFRKEAREAVEKLKKDVEAAAPQLAEAAKKTEEARKAAEAALNKARGDAALTEDEKAKRIAEAEKTLADATASAAGAAEKSKNAEAEKKALADRAKQLSDRWKKRDYKLVTWSNPVRVKLESSPVRFAGESAIPPLAPGATGTVPLRVERHFGFADVVEVVLEIPEASKGAFAAEIVKLAKGVSDGAVKLTAKPDAKSGDYPAKLVAKVKFNGMDLRRERDISVVVIAAAAPASQPPTPETPAPPAP